MCWFFSFSATFIDVVRALLPGGDMGGGMQGPQGLQLKAERGVGFLGEAVSPSPPAMSPGSGSRAEPRRKVIIIHLETWN